MTYQQAYDKLASYGQLHVLRYYDELTPREQEALLAQIDELDFAQLAACKHREELSRRGKITPLSAMQLSEIEANRQAFTEEGLRTIRAGKDCGRSGPARWARCFWRAAWGRGLAPTPPRASTISD